MRVKRYLPYSRQDINEEDINSVVQVLKSDYITGGPKLIELEKELSKVTYSKYAAVLSNGTAGLISACHSLGVKEGDEVIVPNNTFVATVNAIKYHGGTPVVVDSDASFPFHISFEKIKENISPKTVGIILMHYGGMPVPSMDEIKEISDKYGIWIIEDASHASGAFYRSDPIGSCRFSNAVVFSFHPVKILCMGEGGAVTTNDLDLVSKVKQFGNHGITKNKDDYEKPENEAVWYSEMQFLGLNFRMTDIQAALGISQLKRLKLFVDKRNEVAKKYINLFKNYGEIIETPLQTETSGTRCSYHLFPLLVDWKKVKVSKKEFFDKMKNDNIGLQVHYLPISYHPYYKNNYQYKKGDFPISEEMFEKSFSIPIFVSILDQEINYVVSRVISNLGIV